MRKLAITITSNNFLVDTQWGEPINFHKVKISKIVYTPANTTDSFNFRIKTNKFDRTLDTTDGRKYFYIQPVMKTTGLGYLNISNCNDWEYCETDDKYLTDFNMTFYEGTTLVPDNHLATNPVFIELTFK